MSDHEFKTLLEARDEGDLRQRAQELVVSLGFDYYLYATGIQVGNSTPGFNKLITTYPPAWIEKYINEGFAAIDPAVRHCMENRTPFIWTMEAFEHAGAGHMFAEAQRHGLVSGISIPLFDIASGYIGGMGLACRNKTCRGLEDAGRTVLLAMHFQEAYSRFATPFLRDVGATLSRLEGECLAWVADGWNVAQISQRLDLSESKVEQLLELVLRKLDARSMPQAVAYAFAGGLLSCVPGHPTRPAPDEQVSPATSAHHLGATQNQSAN